MPMWAGHDTLPVWSQYRLCSLWSAAVSVATVSPVCGCSHCKTVGRAVSRQQSAQRLAAPLGALRVLCV